MKRTYNGPAYEGPIQHADRFAHAMLAVLLPGGDLARLEAFADAPGYALDAPERVPAGSMTRQWAGVASWPIESFVTREA